MATAKKTVPQSKKVNVLTEAAPQKSAVKISVSAGTSKEKHSEDLIADNIAALSKVVDSLSSTLEILVYKSESMAFHIIATEEILAELVAENGLDLQRVNARIRAKIAAENTDQVSADPAIDAAAAIVSPLRRG